MTLRWILALLLLPVAIHAQMSVGAWTEKAPAKNSAAGPLDYVCPMHPDERSDKPGKCVRCGMTLRLGVPDQSDYSVDVVTSPSNVRAGETVRIQFTFRNPKDQSIVKRFEVVHEKLFHLFIVSSDLKIFYHVHPVPQPDGTFVISQIFPKPGMYRIGADVYPTSGSPQLIDSTIFVSGDSAEAAPLQDAVLEPDLGVQHGENTDVTVTAQPEKAIAGIRTVLLFKFNTAKGMQQYLGAWAHMLIASDDLIDLIHDHPTIADGGDEMQFSIIFPRARTYRIWVQFEREGVVNTVAVNVPVMSLEEADSGK